MAHVSYILVVMDMQTTADLIVTLESNIKQLATLQQHARKQIPSHAFETPMSSRDMCAICTRHDSTWDSYVCGKYMVCSDCYHASARSLNATWDEFMQTYPATRTHAINAILQSFTHAKFINVIMRSDICTTGNCGACGGWCVSFCNTWASFTEPHKTVARMCNACYYDIDNRVRRLTMAVPYICEVVSILNIADVRTYLAGIIYYVATIPRH